MSRTARESQKIKMRMRVNFADGKRQKREEDNDDEIGSSSFFSDPLVFRHFVAY